MSKNITSNKLVMVVAVLLALSSTLEAEDLAHYRSVVRRVDGTAVSGATVAIYYAESTTLVTQLWSDKSGTVPLSNPFLSDLEGDYSFFVSPGLYKIIISAVGIGSVTVDNVPVGTQVHAERHEVGGLDPLNINLLEGEINSEKIENGVIKDEDVSATASIQESKLGLLFPTHSNANDPTVDQKAAMVGTSGLPSSGNKYVTGNDSRLSDSRIPTPHASTHVQGQSDPVLITIGQISGVDVGTNLSSDLEEELHGGEHEDGGDDEISVQGLLGTLNDPQPTSVLVNGLPVSMTKTGIDFVDGTNVSISGVGVGDVVELTINGPDITGSYFNVYEGTLPVVAPPVTELRFSSSGFDVSEPVDGRAVIDIDESELTAAGDVIGNLNSLIAQKVQGNLFEASIPTDGEVPVWLSGQFVYDTPNAYSLRGDPIAATIPLDGQALVFDTIAGEWGPGDVATQIPVEENDVEVVSAAKTFDFGDGFDLGESPAGEVNIALDLSELEVASTSLRTSPLCDPITPAGGQVLKYNGTSSCWESGTDESSGSVTVEQNDVAILSTSIADFRDSFSIVSETTEVAIRIADNGIGEQHIDWGVGANQVSTDTIPEGSTNKFFTSALFDSNFGGKTADDLTEGTVNQYFTPSRFDLSFSSKTTNDLAEGSSYKYLTSAQKTGLTGGGDTTYHYHSSDRNLANATGTLPATSVGSGLTDAQISDTMTISSSGSVDGGSVKSGTVPSARLGNVRYQWKTVIVPYGASVSGKEIGYVYFPVAVTAQIVAGRVRGSGSCNLNIYDDGSPILTTDLQVTSTGQSSSGFSSTQIAAGSWIEFRFGSCSATGEVSSNFGYTIN